MWTTKAIKLAALPALFLGMAACGHSQETGHPDIPGFVQTMVRELGSCDARTRFAAARALGIVGPRAEAAIPFLQEAMCDANERVRDAADLAIRRIEGTAPPYQDPSRKVQMRPWSERS